MKTFIVAECGINANGDVGTAKQQIDYACVCGVDAVKFQVYDSYKLYGGDTNARYYKDSKRGEFSHSVFRVLADYSPIEWFATPFDVEAVDLLESIGVHRYKVASRSLTDHQLLEKISQTKKPVVMSTGRHPVVDIKKALNILNGIDVTLLYCVPDYPTKVSDVIFDKIKLMEDIFKVRVGFSDHTLGIWASIEAVRRGACMIEKHFTINRSLEGCDQPCSLEPQEMKLLVKSIRQMEEYGI